MSSKDNLALMPKEPIQNLTEFASVVATMRDKLMNVLSPITKMDRMLPMHGLALALVAINPDPASGDVWHDPRWKNNEFALTHVSLNRLFVSAGGTWVHNQCGRVDDRSDAFYIEWTCVGRMKDPTGAQVEAQATKRLDLRVDSPEVKGWTPDRLNEARRFILEQAESKAQNRVIRKLLGIKSKYKEDEIKRPFVVVRSVPLLDMSNPAVADAMTRFALGGTEALYGPSRQEEVRQIEHVETREIAAIPPHLANDAEDDALVQGTHNAPAFQTEDNKRDFGAADKETQLRTLAEMIKAKGFAEDRLNKPLTQFSEKEREELFNYLESRPAPTGPAFKL